MLKGVNLQVIEINNPNAEYFERVLYVVKPEFSQTSRSKLLKEAQAMTDGDNLPPLTKRRSKLVRTLVIIGSALLGAGIAAGICIAIL